MIVYKEGDVLKSGADVIAHQVNCMGVMGGGIAKQIRELYPIVYNEYRDICAKSRDGLDLLGLSHWVQIDDTHYIVNMFGQHGFGNIDCYTIYPALRVALMHTVRICEYLAIKKNDTVRLAMPWKIGCGLAGGDWDIVYKMINDIADKTDVVIELWKLR